MTPKKKASAIDASTSAVRRLERVTVGLPSNYFTTGCSWKL
jgi:hypothetical protein